MARPLWRPSPTRRVRVQIVRRAGPEPHRGGRASGIPKCAAHSLPVSYRYHEPPEIHALSPASGPGRGGTAVEITGNRLFELGSRYVCEFNGTVAPRHPRAIHALGIRRLHCAREPRPSSEGLPSSGSAVRRLLDLSSGGLQPTFV